MADSYTLTQMVHVATVLGYAIISKYILLLTTGKEINFPMHVSAIITKHNGISKQSFMFNIFVIKIFSWVAIGYPQKIFIY